MAALFSGQRHLSTFRCASLGETYRAAGFNTAISMPPVTVSLIRPLQNLRHDGAGDDDDDGS
jgi:hypothetical protein